jgi:hypothetical protein
MAQVAHPSHDEQAEEGKQVLKKLTSLGMHVLPQRIEHALVAPVDTPLDALLQRLPQPGVHSMTERGLPHASALGKTRPHKRGKKKKKKKKQKAASR